MRRPAWRVVEPFREVDFSIGVQLQPDSVTLERPQKNRRRPRGTHLAAALTLLLFAGLPSRASATSFVIDQDNYFAPTSFALTPSPNGQQFRPMLPWLGAIDVWLKWYDEGGGPINRVHLAVYQHDTFGTLLGVSDSIDVTASAPGQFYAFSFPTPVKVGTQTVFKIVGGRAIVGLGPPDSYPLGDAVWDDNPIVGVDLVFRTWGSPSPPFTDDPLVQGSTAIKATHVMELRSRIDAVRMARGLPAFGWGPAITAGTSVIQAQDVIDLRKALDQAYDQIPRTHFGYTRSIVVGQTIQAMDIEDTRSALVAVE